MHWMTRSLSSSKAGKFKHAGILLHNPVHESRELSLLGRLGLGRLWKHGLGLTIVHGYS